MDKFKLETSLSFPYLKLHEDITYAEVKKPSGVAYILLVLIAESKNKRETLENILISFGIPKSLHYIFTEELQKLIAEEIIACHVISYQLETLTMDSFEFTAKGKKIFSEEAIPTGINKNDRIDLYYDIAMNELMFQISKNLEPRPLADSFITEDFVSKFSCKKSVENFLDLNRGKKWPKFENGKEIGQLLIKKEEIITDIKETQQREFWTAKRDCKMLVDNDNILINFDDETVQKFFDDNYSNKMINDAIIRKNKFKFSFDCNNSLVMSDFGKYEIEKVMMPSEIYSLLNRRYKYIISKGHYNFDEEDKVIVSAEGLNAINDSLEFIVIDRDVDVYLYAVGNFNFKNEKFGNIVIPLVLKLKGTIQDVQKATLPYLNTLKDYTEENFRKLIVITNRTGDVETAKSMINNYFSADPAENINRLNAIKTSAYLNNDIRELFIEIYKNNFDQLVDTVNENNLESILKIARLAPATLEMSKNDILDIYAQKLKDVSNIKTYELFVENGYDSELVSLYFNPIPELKENSDIKETNLLNFVNYQKTINALKSLLEIDDDNYYSIDEDKIDRPVFLDLFKGLVNLKKSSDVFQKSNKDLVEYLDKYYRIFENVNDDINMQVEASKNPKKITKEFVNKKILSGDYRSVFANLAVKLEYLLDNFYHADGNGLFEMLKSSKGIKPSIIDELHKFRETRNNNLHYDTDAEYTVDDLRNWTDTIFELENKDE